MSAKVKAVAHNPFGQKSNEGLANLNNVTSQTPSVSSRPAGSSVMSPYCATFSSAIAELVAFQRTERTRLLKISVRKTVSSPHIGTGLVAFCASLASLLRPRCCRQQDFFYRANLGRNALTA